MSKAIQVTLSLGSNIDRYKHLNAGLNALEDAFGKVISSPIYESDAVGFDGSAFLNSIAIVYTHESLTRTIEILKRIEDDNGRDRSGPKFSPRTLDIDVVTYGDISGEYEGIELPRAELFKNAFVLRPMADLLPNEKVPGKSETYAQLWQQFDQSKQALAPVLFERR
ncbi:2-amino-4-hydroxy-6-hydroxymethyldihydropteridine diphosphokinase [Reinekea forsetii]|nr:2-amino-4-hydroxy-6-hydroxymethyldihydropteridine diphosphokinase [Reinekea forsetii]